MIYCVYLNPTIDHTVYLGEFKVGATNRAEKSITNGAGKAVNIAEALSILGVETQVVGFVFKNDAKILYNRLSKTATPYNFIKLEGNSRVNVKIFDGLKSHITEINDSGVYIDEGHINDIHDKLSKNLKPGDIVVLAGSLPCNWSPETYAYLIDLTFEYRAKAALDTSGEGLNHGIKKAPFIIKPNIDELEAYAGCRLENYRQIAEVCWEIYKNGVSIICVSMGSYGAYMFSRSGAYFAEPISVEVRSTVGAGDSMLAGILANLKRGNEFAFKAGVAAATASLTVEGTGFPSISVYNDMLNKVNIKRMQWRLCDA